MTGQRHKTRAAPLMMAAAASDTPVFKYQAELMETAKAIVAPGKGILAGDESNATIGKRFEDLGIPANHEMRQAYREMLFSAPGIEEHISGCIMFDETARDKCLDGKPFIELLKDRGIYSGIKVDTGVRSLGGTDDEFYTQGLDNLGDRAAEYYAMGCRFAKWRATVRIGGRGSAIPSEVAVKECAHSLARYAMIMQQNGLVPIVEPEILQDGDHDIELCAEVTERVLTCVMKELVDQHCLIEGLLLKPNMVTPGNGNKERPKAEEVAWYTVRSLSRSIVPALPGVTFLSGGTSEEEASTFLNAMQHVDLPKPWALTFSYGRALQTSVMKEWAGKKENTESAQAILLERASANGSA
jgi:fructose-bisphosphate aldolase class I